MLLFLSPQTVTYPLDVIRRRMQVDVRSASGQWQSGHSMLGAARTVMREQGSWLGLFRGLSINYIKVAPSTAVGFTVYDALKSYLNVQGGSVV